MRWWHVVLVLIVGGCLAAIVYNVLNAPETDVSTWDFEL